MRKEAGSMVIVGPFVFISSPSSTRVKRVREDTVGTH